MSTRDEVVETLRGLGYGDDDATTLADHFLDAEARGKRGHGLTRVEWLTTLTDLEPDAQARARALRARVRALGRSRARSGT